MNRVGGFTRGIEVVPTVSASSAYADGDQVGGVQTLNNAALGKNLAATLISLVVVDQAKQDAPLQILFFDESPTVTSSDNAALDIGDAEIEDKFIGKIAVAAADYVDLANGSVASLPLSSLGLALISKEENGNLYAVMRTSGTPTYAATDDLTIKYVFAKDQ